MKERPILFSAPMVLALLAGTKTQTRRVVKAAPGRQSFWLGPETLAAVRRWAPSTDSEQPGVSAERTGWWTMATGKPSRIVHCGHEIDGGHIGSMRCPYGAPGDRLWVRETFVYRHKHDRYYYRADSEFDPYAHNGWSPSIHMPRKASRIDLEVTGVRVERLQDISEDDAKAEGVEAHNNDGVTYYGPLNRDHVDPVEAYRWLWESINGAGSWAKNPWVWCVSFKRVRP